MNIDYDGIISQWEDSVHQYCDAHNIPDMGLKNLRVGDLYDYELYVAHKDVERAVAAYRKLPVSPVCRNDLSAAIKKWYIMTSGKKARKLSMRVMSNDMFIRMFAHVK